MKDDRVIVLNKYESFWTEVNVKKAVSKILNGRAIPIIQDEKELLGVVRTGFHSDSKYVPIYRPLVIKLKYFDFYKYKRENIPYSESQVFLRDKNICQYWHDYKIVNGEKISTARHQHKCIATEKTIDHVTPVSRGGARSSFSNSVCCCRYCNEIIKKDMTPEEAGLELIRQPFIPIRKKGDIAISYFNYNPDIKAHQKYQEYLTRAVSSAG